MERKTKQDIKEIKQAFPSEEADYIIKHIKYGSGERDGKCNHTYKK